MSHSSHKISRRALLSGMAASGLAVALVPEAFALPPVPASPIQPSRAQRWSGMRSANDWPIGADTTTQLVEGAGIDVTLTTGAPSVVLLHALRRINYELVSLRPGDVSGLQYDRNVASPQRSNLLSGTAFLFRESFLPYGSTGNLFPDEIVVLEDIVAESRGVLAWGGHLMVPDQSLIYLAKGPTAPEVGRLRSHFDMVDHVDASGGAGTVDAYLPERRAAAVRELRRRR